MQPTTHALLLTLALVSFLTLGGYFADQLLQTYGETAPPPPPVHVVWNG